jgi:hypothetical protein
MTVGTKEEIVTNKINTATGKTPTSKWIKTGTMVVIWVAQAVIILQALSVVQLMVGV